jgi:Icc protein
MHRIVQITDCHLFADRAASLREICTWPRLEAVLADIRRQVPKIDLLVFTGDTAHDEQRATYERVKGELAEWVGRVRIIPGNHDDRAGLREVFSIAPVGPADRVMFHHRWSDWQVIGLDSQQRGELHGLLGPEQLAWLQRQLDATTGLPTLLFLHHPPIAVGSPWLDKIALQDAAELGRLLGAHPHVRVVACGHVHQEVAGSFNGAAVFTTPAVGPPFRPRTELLEIDDATPGYRVLELLPDGGWSTQVLRCPLAEAFLPSAGAGFGLSLH